MYQYKIITNEEEEFYGVVCGDMTSAINELTEFYWNYTIHSLTLTDLETNVIAFTSEFDMENIKLTKEEGETLTNVEDGLH